MKKLVFVLGLGLMFVACGDNQEADKQETTTSTQQEQGTSVEPTPAIEDIKAVEAPAEDTQTQTDEAQDTQEDAQDATQTSEDESKSTDTEEGASDSDSDESKTEAK